MQYARVWLSPHDARQLEGVCTGWIVNMRHLTDGIKMQLGGHAKHKGYIIVA